MYKNLTMKILVCGATGILGTELCKLFDLKNVDYIGIYNRNKIHKDNYYHFNQLDNVINLYKPTHCINCIVNRDVNECETKWNTIKEINIDITERLAKYKNIKLIHISTDYVFDGKNPPYYEDSEVNPLQNYGISKYISERRVIANCDWYLIIRVPVLFSNSTDNALFQICKKLMNTLKTTFEDDISIRRPVYIPILCTFIHDAIINNYSGIYHFYNPIDRYTKYQLVQILSKIINKPSDHILPSYDITNRPIDTQLIDKKYDIYNYYKDYNFENILSNCFKKYYHPSDYKDCFILLDLDGTLINSIDLHYKSYNSVIQIDRNEFNILIQNNNLTYPNDLIREKKYEIFKNNIHELTYIKNAEAFIEYINENNINHAVVTNTNKVNVELIKDQLPLLKKLKNWVTREEYSEPKPNQECYNYAIEKYYKNEKYIIGFEDTVAGYNALKNITSLIYIITHNEHYFKDLDVFISDKYIVP